MTMCVMSWQTPRPCSHASRAVDCTLVTPAMYSTLSPIARAISAAASHGVPAPPAISSSERADLLVRLGAHGLRDLLHVLGGPLDVDREVVPAELVRLVRARPHLDEARRRELERPVGAEDLERRDPGAEVVDVGVVPRLRLDVEVRVQDELVLAGDGQHARLVVRRRHLALVVAAGPVGDAQTVHEFSPTQLGAALVGK